MLFLTGPRQVGKTTTARSCTARYRFKAQIGARHAFQLAFDLPYVDRDCFEITEPVSVPARTLLSQLP